MFSAHLNCSQILLVKKKRRQKSLSLVGSPLKPAKTSVYFAYYHGSILSFVMPHCVQLES